MDFTAVKKALESHHFQVSIFSTGAEAADYLDRVIDNKTVGFGGSQTLEQLDLFNRLGAHNEVFDHWHIPADVNIDEARKDAMHTEVYLTSANGLAETGEIINIDGTGNRVSSILFGHRKVYFVIGSNKLAPDYDKALWRARNISAPLNAKRMGRMTPCAVRGDRCYDCKSPDRICRGLVVLWECMKSCQMEVVLIDEPLGY